MKAICSFYQQGPAGRDLVVNTCTDSAGRKLLRRRSQTALLTRNLKSPSTERPSSNAIRAVPPMPTVLDLKKCTEHDDEPAGLDRLVGLVSIRVDTLESEHVSHISDHGYVLGHRILGPTAEIK